MQELTKKKTKIPTILDELKDFSDEYIENVIFKKNKYFISF